jgi:protein ImuA
MTEPTSLSVARNRAVVMDELRRLLPRMERTEGLRKALPFGLAALDSHLPANGLPCGALHEVVPAAASALPAAFGFIAAILARLPRAHPAFFVMPAYGPRQYGRSPGRLHGHGLRALGLDPARLILVETANRKETLWAMEEALRSAAPAAVAGLIDQLDLKISQRLQLAATNAGVPLFLLRPAQTLESSAAATRWRVGTAEAARDRFGLVARPRWHLQLERCRNGRPGQWVVEYDHVAHRFSLAAALADPALSRSASEKPIRKIHYA